MGRADIVMDLHCHVTRLIEKTFICPKRFETDNIHVVERIPFGADFAHSRDRFESIGNIEDHGVGPGPEVTIERGSAAVALAGLLSWSWYSKTTNRRIQGLSLPFCSFISIDRTHSARIGATI